MDKPIPMTCSAATYHALSVAADSKTRGGNKFVKVSKSALAALLTDHGTIHAKLHECGVHTLDAPSLASDSAENDVEACDESE